MFQNIVEGLNMKNGLLMIEIENLTHQIKNILEVDILREQNKKDGQIYINMVEL